MSSINAMFEQVKGLPGRGTPEEARKAARVLAAIGRRLGADDRETADVIASLGLDQAPDYRAVERYCDVCRAANTAKAAQRVRVHVESRRKG